MLDGQNPLARFQSLDYVNSGDLLSDSKAIIDAAQGLARSAVNVALVRRNWLLGRRISEEELQGERRAEYGAGVIKSLASELKKAYGGGFGAQELYKYRRFYETFPEIFDTSSRKSRELLTWSHYRALLTVHNPEARDWYAHEAYMQAWAVKTLQRNVASQYYDRMLLSQKNDLVEAEMRGLTAAYQNDKLEFVKNPVIAEFLGFSGDDALRETDLETAIIGNIQQFLLELGKGYAFIARQQHIRTEKSDYFIDLVFYNVILKCYVLIDLKTATLTHQDIGQMDMYVRMYDELKRTEWDGPTLGIVLCADADEDVARYSVLRGNEQLFASKYKLYLPTEEELRAEIEAQKTFFYLQQVEREISDEQD